MMLNLNVKFVLPLQQHTTMSDSRVLGIAQSVCPGPSTNVFFARFMTMRETQSLAKAVIIEKETWM